MIMWTFKTNKTNGSKRLDHEVLTPSVIRRQKITNGKYNDLSVSGNCAKFGSSYLVWKDK